MGDSNNKSIRLSKSNHKSSKLISERQKKTSIKGTASEYHAISELTKAGYYVAKSCDPHCPFDIVIVDKNGKIQLLDIKTNTYRYKIKGKALKNKRKIFRSPTKEQKKLNIKLLMVDYEDK